MTDATADTESLPTEAGPTPRRGAARYAVMTFLVLGTIATALAILAVWANRQVLNTDDWTDTSTHLLENQEIRETVANFLVEQLYANVDVGAQIQRVLPSQLDPLSGPAAAGLRELAIRGANELLSTSQVQDLWKQANAAAHQELLDILFDRSQTVNVTGDTVTLNLGALVTQVGERLGVDQTLLGRIPPGTAQVEVLRSDQVRVARSVAQGLQGLTSILTILAVALFVLAVALAGGWRRVVLRTVGICMVIAGAVVLLGRDIAGNAVVEALAQTAAVEDAARPVWSIGTSLLVVAAQSVVLYGLLLVVGAWVAGPTQPAVALRRLAAPFSNGQPAVAYGAGLLIVAVIALWAPTAALRSATGLLVLLGLVALGTEVLRRQLASEFPEEQRFDLRPHVDRVRTGARGAYDRATSRLSQKRESDTLARLERLAALRREGVLTEEEADAQKKLILKGTEPL